MNRIFFYSFMVLGFVCTLVALAGFIKFSILADDIYVELATGTVVPYDETDTMPTADLIVLSAPSVLDDYYADTFAAIVDFQVEYANAVHGKDTIKILVDADTRPYFADRVPAETLITAQVDDIWIRDFATVNPAAPAQFRYSAASLPNQRVADQIQESFNRFAKQRMVPFQTSSYILDGGNIVDSYSGRVVTTTRFLTDNNLTKEAGKTVLRNLLGATEVAIIPPDDEVLAHSDSMVLFTDHDTIIINQYDEPFRSAVRAELTAAFPDISIVEIAAAWDDATWDGVIGSACGVNVNAVVTTNYIYVPHFGDTNSDTAIATIAAQTDKTVVPIPAAGVCHMGGSVRCLSWQLQSMSAQQFLGITTQ